MKPSEEKTLLTAVVSFPITPDRSQVWLATKAKNIGAGALNGYGGGVEPGESVVQCAKRELLEESRINEPLEKFEKMAIMTFHNQRSDGTTFSCNVHIYVVVTDQIPKETTEMLTPTLFSLTHVPLEKMMLADKVWFPKLWSGKKFIGQASYGPKQKTLLSEVKLTFVEPLPE